MTIRTDFEQTLRHSRELSWKSFGRAVTFFLPGMFIYRNMRGRYPALSITGSDCSLMCAHCQGKILQSMHQAREPEELVRQCRELEEKGAIGVLLSGGCDDTGALPWQRFLGAIEEIKATTGLLVSAHTGFVDAVRAAELRSAGLDQALIDVIGDSRTFERIFHINDGPLRLHRSLEALFKANIEVVPHIVCGIDHGKIVGEFKAVELLEQFNVKKLVIVSLMRLSGTPAAQFNSIEPQQVAAVITTARTRLPQARLSLGCARQRGSSELEIMAIKAGVNSMALPSDEAISLAESFNLHIRYQKTCCSVSADFSTDSWN